MWSNCEISILGPHLRQVTSVFPLPIKPANNQAAFVNNAPVIALPVENPFFNVQISVTTMKVTNNFFFHNILY